MQPLSNYFGHLIGNVGASINIDISIKSVQNTLIMFDWRSNMLFTRIQAVPYIRTFPPIPKVENLAKISDSRMSW